MNLENEKQNLFKSLFKSMEFQNSQSLAKVRDATMMILVVCAMIFPRHVAQAELIPQDVKKTVAFVFYETHGKAYPLGTGFFVGVENKSSDRTGVSWYFVTAKHVLQDGKAKKFYKRIYVRVNKYDGDSVFIPMNLRQDISFFLHSDPTVDIAVIPAYVDTRVFDVKYLPEEIIATKKIFEHYQIQEGDEIFFIGLFANYVGMKQNAPIIRFGRIALLPQEKISWESAPTDLYVMDTFTFGGNSGSPVFIHLTATRIPRFFTADLPKVFLGGVMLGYFSTENQLVDAGIKQKMKRPFENMGIAAVAPAEKLHEILFSKQLVELRNNATGMLRTK